MRLTLRRKPKTIKPTGVTHDLRRKYWGHDYVWDPADNGATGRLTGWHPRRIAAGDYVVFGNGQGARYKIEEIEWYSNPSDMFTAKVSFAARTVEQVAADEENFGTAKASASPYV